MSRRGLKILVPLALAATVVALGGTTAQSQLPAQSPINVTSFQVDPHQPKLNVHYSHANLELEYIRKDSASPNGCTTRHHEETEEAHVPAGAGYVTVAGVRYNLEQFHFHTPAEHKFGGRQDPLEMHLVHRSAAGKLLVIGVPLRVGGASTVDTVLAKLAPECGASIELHNINLNSLLPSNLSTLRYNGSLTTAPFSEDVQWLLTGHKSVSQATLTRFQQLFTSGNSRAVQPLNGRTVTEVPQF